ncbi:hypothetical protein B296_00030783 [Ensete ventricosum]|uniref:HTH La-type RNA-binding domain-containing protein n=1 Tax=Ensete ventricosum TaxID=4639 RepID=A0A426YWG2_ENSVE|nr:hypothetical protein B296_00030783 [Ensete ventricosum]
MGMRKSGGFGSNNSSKHHSVHSNKHGPRRNTPVNGGPSFPVHFAYHQQPGQPVFYPVLQPQTLIVHDYAYQTCRTPFPNGQPHIVKSGESHMPAFVPTGQAGGNEGNRNLQPLPRGDPNNWHPGAGYGGRPYNVCEHPNNLNQTWGNHRAFGPRDSINMPQAIGPRTFIRPVPRFVGPAPGFINGPGFTGNSSSKCPPPPMYYVSPAPLEMMHGPPRFSSHPSPPVYPSLTPEMAALRANIVRQIEYYFSDENLKTDLYLISLLDEQGWVPIYRIADFNRVKKMTNNIPLILDALQGSTLVEVQHDRIRRRGDWSKWVKVSTHSTVSPQPQLMESQSSVRMEKIDTTETNGHCISHNSHQAVTEDNDEYSDQINHFYRRETNKYSELFSESGQRDPCSGCSFTLGNDSTGSYIDVNIKLSDAVSSRNSEDAANLSSSDPKIEKNIFQAERSGTQNSDFDNGFLDESLIFNAQSTFMLDEELELEQTTNEMEHLSLRKRVDDEEDEMDVNDQDVHRLIIVTQARL